MMIIPINKWLVSKPIIKLSKINLQWRAHIIHRNHRLNNWVRITYLNSGNIIIFSVSFYFLNESLDISCTFMPHFPLKKSMNFPIFHFFLHLSAVLPILPCERRTGIFFRDNRDKKDHLCCRVDDEGIDAQYYKTIHATTGFLLCGASNFNRSRKTDECTARDTWQWLFEISLEVTEQQVSTLR